MKIKAQDWEYGAVLHQIVMHPVFTSINKVEDKAGLYQINGGISLLIKCSNGDGPEWSFTFSREDVKIATRYDGYCALNCGSQTVCLLKGGQLASIVDLNATGSQQVKVSFSNNESMRVWGPVDKLDRTVPHNAFPGEIFGRVQADQEAHAWPELGVLKLYAKAPQLLVTSCYRNENLPAALVHRLHGSPKIGYIGVSSISQQWPTWNEVRLRQVEAVIKSQMVDDGYKVVVERHTSPVNPRTSKKDRPCSDEFVWKLTILSRAVQPDGL